MEKLQPCAAWSNDCCGKKDYDGRLVSISTRYWPRGGGFMVFRDGALQDNNPDIKPSATAAIILNHGTPDEPDGFANYIELASQEFEAETEGEVMAQVEAWVAGKVNGVYGILRDAEI